MRKKPFLLPDEPYTVRPETDMTFLQALQNGLLLALQEQGILSPAQSQQAMEKSE